MGYIKKLKNNELVGGTDKTTIYPVTSTEAVFEEITNGSESSFKSQKTINKEQQDILDNHEERIQTAEAEDIKSITINGSTKKFEVDDENNVDLTIYTVDSDPEMPGIADNVRELRNTVGTSIPVLETSHKTRIETLETTVGTGGTIDSRIATTRAELQEQIDTKQIQLHVGSGLTLDNNGNLSATLDPAMSKVVTAWPSQASAVKGLIYLKPTSTAGVYEQRVYNDSSYTTLDNVTLSISTDDALNTGSANPLKNSTVAAQIGYFDHTGNNDNDGSSKVKNITATGFTLPTTAGGAIKIKMKEPNTYAGTQADPVQLQFNNVTSTKKTLLYNHEIVSATNTWERDEVISVYYDGTYYQASNAQGGGGKAEKIKYNNSQSGLAAQNVQGALDEVAVNIEEVDLSKYRVASNNLEQNATVWKQPNQSFKSIIVPRCVFGDYLKLSPTNYKVSYAFLEYDNSGTKSAAVPFAGTQTTATTIPAGSNPVTVKIPSDCGCVYFYISEYSRDEIGDYYQVYSITERKDELDEMLVPTFGTEEAYDIKAGIVATNYNTNSGTFVISRTYQGTFNRALTQYPFILEKGEWLKCTALDASVSIIAMSIDNDNHYLGYDFDIISNASGVIKGDGEKKAIWVKWTDDATVTNVVELLKHISIVRGYDCSYSKKGTSDLKAIASENTDAGTSWLKEQLVLGGYTYSFGTVPQYSITAKTSVVSNSPCWLDDDIVIEFDDTIRCKTYILANDGTFRTSVQWASPMTIRGGRYIIMVFSYPDNRTITDIDSVLSLIRISKKKRIGADFLIDRNQNAVNAIVASKKRFNRTISSYAYNNPNHSECFTIAHLTDIHTDGERFENFRRFVDNLGYIDAAILTGDLVIDPTEEQFKTITDVGGKKDVMMCVGNHDRVKAYGDTIVMSLEDTYANMFTARDVETNTGELYYYKDFIGTTKVQDKTLSSPVYKIRVIVLNCYDCDSDNATYAGVNLHWSQAQIDWFIATLQDSITNGYSVMVAMHATDQQKLPVSNSKKFYQDHVYNETTPDSYEQYPIIEDIINAFKHGTSLTRNYTWSDISETVSVDVSFATAGTFIAYMCGHYHMDLIGVSQNYSDQLYLVGNCGHGYSYFAGRSYGEEWTPLSRVLGTKSEDCFNVYSINLEDKTIRVVRVGADINDKMEKVDFETYSFD